MSEVMNRYELQAPFTNMDAGFSRWTYAIKEGKEFFLKEFIDPVYPTDESISVGIREQRISECEMYEQKKRKLYKAINRASDGNLVRIEEFFRFDNRYYITTEKIEAEKISLEEIAEIPFENRILLCKALAHAVMKLHEQSVVHADIKASNVLIKETVTGKYVGKVIDFDAGFLETDPPRYEDELSGDQVYFSPEACKFVCGDSVKLTTKMDVFALGLLFHQYLTGELPGFDVEEYDYAFYAVLDEQKLIVSEELPSEIRAMIEGMLVCEPEKRFSMQKVFDILQNWGKESKQEENPECEMEDYWFTPAGEL